MQKSVIRVNGTKKVLRITGLDYVFDSNLSRKGCFCSLFFINYMSYVNKCRQADECATILQNRSRAVRG